MNLEQLMGKASAFQDQLGHIVRGQEEAVELILIGLLSSGHVLLEGAPGTAKTLLSQSVASSLALGFGRIQFTPDLMPGDVLGTSLYDFSSGRFNLTKGPIFTEVLLADEINRAPPKSQAALLQAMNERRVTLDGTEHDLGEDFFVIATQNPIEQQGTYPLPEAQLDRFLFKLLLHFPDEATEIDILAAHAAGPLQRHERLDALSPVFSRDELSAARQLIDGIRLSDEIIRYIVRLVRATRQDPDISHGASTRAADALAAAARARAALSGRDFSIPDDLKLLFLPALRHRIVLSASAEIEGRNADQALQAILERIEAPR